MSSLLQFPTEIQNLIFSYCDAVTVEKIESEADSSETKPKLRFSLVLPRVCKQFHEATLSLYTERDLARLVPFREQYPIPKREGEISHYHLLWHSIIVISKIQEEALSLSGLTAFESLEKIKLRNESEILRVFCSLLGIKPTSSEARDSDKISDLAKKLIAWGEENSKLSLKFKKLKWIPNEVCLLPNLSELDLSFNQLKTFPEGISALTNLSRLSLSTNHLMTFPEGISALTNLSWLDLSTNHLTAVPEGISALTNLSRLSLSGNYIPSATITDLQNRLGARCEITT